MLKTDPQYQDFLSLLKHELVPAMGCTEPVAIALACAKARDVLGACPTSVILHVSGNIIKNVKSVTVPNTDGGKGIKTAAAIGIVVGHAENGLQVISSVTDAQRDEMRTLLETCHMEVIPSESGEVFDIDVEISTSEHCARVRIITFHTNIVLVQLDGEDLLCTGPNCMNNNQEEQKPPMSVKSILDFADTADIADVKEILDRQIQYNSAISQEGLTGKWGAAVGCTLLNCYGNDVAIRARAAAAAGSDARMSGCELPVVINSGSGNQGITASMPVIVYAKELNCSDEQLYRALLVSNLLTLHLKSGIGRLSAYCGAVCAGCAAGAAIAYLHGGSEEDVSHALVNGLAIVSGIVCDGAKPSCAGKIASAVDAGIVGWKMYQNGKQFYGGDGIVQKGVEESIRAVCRVGHDGMVETDREILKIMTEN